MQCRPPLEESDHSVSVSCFPSLVSTYCRHTLGTAERAGPEQYRCAGIDVGSSQFLIGTRTPTFDVMSRLMRYILRKAEPTQSSEHIGIG
jgi:hypothetical protein